MKNSKKITSIETSSSGNRFWLSATGSDGEYAFAITNTGIIHFKNNNSTWDEIANITIYFYINKLEIFLIKSTKRTQHILTLRP